MATTQIALRLPEEDLRFLDRVVEEQRFGTRADALRAAVTALRRQVIDDELAAAYDRSSQVDTDAAEGEAWVTLGAEHLTEFFADDALIEASDRASGDVDRVRQVSAQLQRHVSEIAKLVSELADGPHGGRG